jgi:hypothetical protein
MIPHQITSPTLTTLSAQTPILWMKIHAKNKWSGLGVVVHAYNPNYSGGKGRRILVQGQFQEKWETLYEK